MELFGRLDDLRESLMAARLLREEIHAAPVRPSDRGALAASFVDDNAAGVGSRVALEVAMRLAREGDTVRVAVEDLARMAEAVGEGGGGGIRAGAGEPFQGQASPPAEDVPGLLGELLDTVNSGVAAESWPPPLRAIGLHFLLRVVQPFEASAAIVGAAAEAMLLGADGFETDRMLLAERDVVGTPASGEGRVDADAFARARVHRLVERLGESRERVRAATARAVLLSWVEERAAGLGARQEQLLRYLAEGGGARTLTFREYVGLHAGRRAPALRTLQRDWQVLCERGWLTPGPGSESGSAAGFVNRSASDAGESFGLSTAPLEFGT